MKQFIKDNKKFKGKIKMRELKLDTIIDFAWENYSGSIEIKTGKLKDMYKSEDSERWNELEVKVENENQSYLIDVDDILRYENLEEEMKK